MLYWRKEMTGCASKSLAQCLKKAATLQTDTKSFPHEEPKLQSLLARTVLYPCLCGKQHCASFRQVTKFEEKSLFFLLTKSTAHKYSY